MRVEIANASKVAFLAAAAVIAPPPPVDYEAWAVENLTFAERESPFVGRYNPALFPFFAGVFEALSPEDPCRIVTWAKSAQLGGTVVGTIFTLGSMDMDPCDFLFVHPTEDNGKRWSRLKLAPMMRSTPVIDAAFPVRSRDGADAVLFKERVDGRGSILITGAASPSSLSQVSMRRQVQDDLSKWEHDAKAGDPETQADSRSQAFETAKIFKISTPLVEPGCRITRSFKAGSQESYHVPCPHCGHMHPLEWDNMLANLDEDRPEDAHFSCPACGGVIEEHHRLAMNRAGRWVAAHPAVASYHRSFHLWSAYSPLMSWERIAREWIDAKGDAASEQVFLNDVVGRAYDAAGSAPDHSALMDRAASSSRPRGVVPAGYVVLTLGLDCQDNRVEWQLVGWDRYRRRAVVDHGVVDGHIGTPTTWPRLDAVVSGEWRTEGGGRLAADRCAIDGNAWTEDVWAWAKRHPVSRVIMVRGANSDNAALIAKVKRERTATGKLRQYVGRFYTFNGSVLKMRLYRDLKNEDAASPRYVDFPRGLEEEYFLQLTAERRQEKKNRQGYSRFLWVKDPAQANEALDTMLQAEVAAIRHRVFEMNETEWDALEAARGGPAPDAQLDLEDLVAAPGPAPALRVAAAKAARRGRRVAN
ncbi:terminase GpA [Stappia sp. 22II-S9-Z10]|nr:terminase GpA [Stappia sp. 22II-S9-Z10]